MPGTRVAVVVDWQNSFRSAQDVFGSGTNGNVHPWLWRAISRLTECLVNRPAILYPLAMGDGSHGGPASLALAGHAIRQHKLGANLYRSIEGQTPYEPTTPWRATLTTRLAPAGRSCLLGDLGPLRRGQLGRPSFPAFLAAESPQLHGGRVLPRIGVSILIRGVLHDGGRQPVEVGGLP